MRQLIEKNIKDLIPYCNNSRTHSDEQVLQIASSIKEFGFTNPVLIDGQGGIIAGHGRVMAAQKLKMDEVPTITLSDLSEAQKKAYIIADNKLALNSGWDDELLKIELEQLKELDFDLGLIGFSDDELALLMGGETTEGLVDEDQVPELVDDPVTVLGDVWLLGNHRLMCGDSTSIDAVERLMDGKKADMVFTDPPYGMFLDTDYTKMPKAPNGAKPLKHSKIQGDNNDFTPELINTIFASFDYCKEIFIWGADYFAELIPNKNDGSWIVWDKRVDEKFDKMIGAAFELCWSKSKHQRKIARINNTLFSGEKDAQNKVHPTQKPIKLSTFFFDNWGKENDLVADLFGGSGSTLIACEKTGRYARAGSEEHPPVYCLSLNTGKFKTHDDVIQDFGVPPHLLPELFALAGDSSDNYKPLPGVGLKKAAELLKLTGGLAVALSDAEVLARVRNVVGDALAAKIEQIDGLRDRLIRAKRVATILDSVPIEFSGLEAEPVREPLTEVPAPAVAPLAERFTEPQRTEKVEKPKQAAIVRAEPVAVDRYRLNPFALEPRNPKDAWDAAVSLFESRLYPQYPNPQAILAVVMEGRTLGLPGPTALKNAYIVSGRVGWSARLLRGLCLKHAQICEYFDIAESTPERATAKVKRIGRPELIVQTTLAEAQKRGLVRGGSKWAQDPLSMCVADVERRGARLVFPDIVAGLWTPEELEAGADERGLELLEAAA
jgi:DNA modification methylase